VDADADADADADQDRARDEHEMAIVIDAFSAQMPLRYQRCSQPGGSAARNHGLELASAPLVLFLDDDMRLEPGALAQMQRSHQDDQATVVIGPVGLSSDAARSALLRHVIDNGLLYPVQTDGDQPPVWLNYNALHGQPCCWDRAALQQQGGFSVNPSFANAGADREAAWRMFAANEKVLFNPLAGSTLAATPGLEQLCESALQQGQADRQIATLHPASTATLSTPIADLDWQWQQLRPRLAGILRSARQLDRIASEHSAAGLPMDGLATRLLLRGYDSSLAASRIAGAAASEE